MEQVSNYLKELGFSEIEANIYIALLRESPMTIKEVSERIKIQRTRAYPYISQLLEKGVIYSSSDSRKSFSAASVEQLRQLVEQKITNATHLQKTFPHIANVIQLASTTLEPKNNDDLLKFTTDLIQEAFMVLYDGRCVPLQRLITLIEEYTSKFNIQTLTGAQMQKFYELKGLSIYLQGRLLGCISRPQNVLSQMNAYADELFSLSKIANNNELTAYAYILLADAYYISGGYSMDESKKRFYVIAMKYARDALPLLGNKNQDRLFAMRIITASAISQRNKEEFNLLKNMGEKLLLAQPFENRITALHLSGVLTRGNAFFKLENPLSLKEKAVTHFGTNLKGTGVFEVSDIRNELETLSLMKSKEKEYMKYLATKGNILAEQDNLIRYKDYFTKILPTL